MSKTVESLQGWFKGLRGNIVECLTVFIVKQTRDNNSEQCPVDTEH